MSGLKKHIYEEKNGLHYTLNGDYYLPDLKLPEEHRPIGKYGRMHREYLREVHPARFDDTQVSLKYDFAFNMSEETIDEFEEIPQVDIAPEVGFRGCITPFVVQNIETREALGFMFWNHVQEGQYRYQVSYNEDGGICVKIVIYEMLYCHIDFN